MTLRLLSGEVYALSAVDPGIPGRQDMGLSMLHLLRQHTGFTGNFSYFQIP